MMSLRKPTYPVIDRRHPLSQGLVGWWMMNEGAGKELHDWSGRGNTGTLNNSPSWTSGLRGPALGFNGAQDVSCGSVISGFFNTFTIAGWMYKGSTSNDIEFGYGSYNPNRLNLVWWSDGNLYYQVGPAFNSLPCNVIGWHHFVSSIDTSLGSAGNKIYIDGQLQASNSAVAYDTTGMLFYIGSEPSNTRYGTGRIDDVRVYTRCLSVADVQLLYYNPFANLVDIKQVASGSIITSLNKSRYFFFFN
jgi:hypothetical protein